MFDQAGKNGKVEATAGKHCQFDVPFSVQVSFCFVFVFVNLPTNPVGKCVGICVSASKHLQGKKQSELTVKILGNDGKELKEGQDINVTMHDGKISVNVINPKRGKSGTFKVTLSRL